MPKNRLEAIPLGIFNTAALTATYQPIYVGGLPHALAIMRIINRSTVDVLLSFDGVTDHDYLMVDSTYILPAQMNSQPRNQVMYIPAGYILSVKQVQAPGVGNLYISGYYTGE